MKALLVLCTVGKAEDAEWIGREMVDRGLAACVNILPPMTSIYRWRGEVERADETLMLFKTTDERFEGLREAIVGLHSYDVPEVIAIPVAQGHAPYLAWLQESVEK